MAFTAKDAKALHGLTVVDPEAAHVGRLDGFYVDRRTGLAEWATVRTGLFGSKLSFVPMTDAHKNPAGDVGRRARRHCLEGAPRIEPGDALSLEQEQELYAYYGRPDDAPPDGGAALEAIDMGAG